MTCNRNQGGPNETILQKISLAFAAGCLGGLINTIVRLVFRGPRPDRGPGSAAAPPFTAPWLYQRLVWGGLWGWLFLLPLTGLSYPVRGLLYSLGPSLVQLFVVFPFQAHKGVLGLQLGYLTPVFVLFYNAVWGLAAGWWLQLTDTPVGGPPA